MSGIVELEINKKNRWIYFTKYRWVAHVVYWLWVLLIGTLIKPGVPVTASLIFNNFFLNNLLIAIFYYVYCLFLIPYFFKRNKNLLFWTLVILSFLGIAALDVVYHELFVNIDNMYPGLGENAGFIERYHANLGGYLVNFVIFSLMLFFMEKNEERDTLLELEKEKKEIEQVKLDLLKTKISPDFLMRSLAQLKQSAALQDNNTPEAILTFSDLLRYRLYRGRNQYAPLAEEIQALQSFIHFTTLNQQDNNLKVELNIQGDTTDKFIAPLALMNLLAPFCKVLPTLPVLLEMILLVEDDKIILEMDYHTQATNAIIDDLNDYGDNYKRLYGDSIKFEFENCEDERCTISLILPLQFLPGV